MPADLAARIDPQNWIEDWRVMAQPGRIDTQRALIADYGRHAAQFDAIAAYIKQHQPPALLLWGRHDAFFDLAEVTSWLADLPRMEAHLFDAGHFLLETHAAPAATLIADFLAVVKRQKQTQSHRPPPPAV